jgi:polar amino acid transport system substrate-binding protein
MHSIARLTALVFVTSLAHAETLYGYTEEFAPYNYMAGTQHKGLANQIIDRIIEQSGLSIQRESLPWLRALQEVNQKENSLLYSTVRTPQRENQYLWVGPYDDCNVSFIKLKSRSDIQLNSVKDAEKYFSGAVRGTATLQILQNQNFNLNRVDISSPEEARTVKMLYAKRFDLSIGLLIPHIYSAKKLGLDASQLTVAYPLLKGSGCYFAFNPKVNSAQFQRFRDAFALLKNSGELELIRRQYLGSETSAPYEAKP